MKRGQVTIFMIIGFVILASVFIIISVYSDDKIEVEKVQVRAITTDPVRSYVESCIESTAFEGIKENGFSGGYFVLPDLSTQDLFHNVPYFYKDGLNLFPSDEMIGQEIAAYIDATLDFCLDDFKVFETQGYTIVQTKPVSKVTVGNGKVTIQTNIPLSISLGSTTQEISTFEVDINSEQLFESLSVAKEIVNSQEGREICITCFSNIAANNDIFVNIFSTDNGTVFDLRNNNNLINKEPYQFRFAVHHEE